MRLIDEIYTQDPAFGVEKVTVCLRNRGHIVNEKRTRRLMRKMGLEAIYPKPRLSQGNKEHEKYPYLLKGLQIERPNHVWCTDITYIPMTKGFIYLVAIMDWFSRYVLSWNVSITMEVDFCLEALENALKRQASAEIFNSDQGSQFTSKVFTNRVKDAGMKISMDGRGRVFDNIFIERLWRTVKYEEVYLKEYHDVLDAVKNLGSFFRRYNEYRPHQSLEYKTPEEIHLGQVRK
jgi:putative transposase